MGDNIFRLGRIEREYMDDPERRDGGGGDGGDEDGLDFIRMLSLEMACKIAPSGNSWVAPAQVSAHVLTIARAFEAYLVGEDEGE